MGGDYGYQDTDCRDHSPTPASTISTQATHPATEHTRQLRQQRSPVNYRESEVVKAQSSRRMRKAKAPARKKPKSRGSQEKDSESVSSQTEEAVDTRFPAAGSGSGGVGSVGGVGSGSVHGFTTSNDGKFSITLMSFY